MASEYEHIRIPAQDFFEDQDPEHRAADEVSGANCVPEQTVLPFQRKFAPLVAQFRVAIPVDSATIGIAISESNEARVTQPQRIEGVVARNEGTGLMTQLDGGTSRRTRSNANHVPIRDLSVVDLAEATTTFLGAGNKKRTPIKGRPVASFRKIKDN
jgi:hypothetical protein